MGCDGAQLTESGNRIRKGHSNGDVLGVLKVDQGRGRSELKTFQSFNSNNAQDYCLMTTESDWLWNHSEIEMKNQVRVMKNFGSSTFNCSEVEVQNKAEYRPYTLKGNTLKIYATSQRNSEGVQNDPYCQGRASFTSYMH